MYIDEVKNFPCPTFVFLMSQIEDETRPRPPRLTQLAKWGQDGCPGDRPPPRLGPQHHPQLGISEASADFQEPQQPALPPEGRPPAEARQPAQPAQPAQPDLRGKWYPMLEHPSPIELWQALNDGGKEAPSVTISRRYRIVPRRPTGFIGNHPYLEYEAGRIVELKPYSRKEIKDLLATSSFRTEQYYDDAVRSGRIKYYHFIDPDSQEHHVVVLDGPTLASIRARDRFIGLLLSHTLLTAETNDIMRAKGAIRRWKVIMAEVAHQLNRSRGFQLTRETRRVFTPIDPFGRHARDNLGPLIADYANLLGANSVAMAVLADLCYRGLGKGRVGDIAEVVDALTKPDNAMAVMIPPGSQRRALGIPNGGLHRAYMLSTSAERPQGTDTFHPLQFAYLFDLKKLGPAFIGQMRVDPAGAATLLISQYALREASRRIETPQGGIAYQPIPESDVREALLTLLKYHDKPSGAEENKRYRSFITLLAFLARYFPLATGSSTIKAIAYRIPGEEEGRSSYAEAQQMDQVYYRAIKTVAPDSLRYTETTTQKDLFADSGASDALKFLFRARRRWWRQENIPPDEFRARFRTALAMVDTLAQKPETTKSYRPLLLTLKAALWENYAREIALYVPMEEAESFLNSIAQDIGALLMGDNGIVNTELIRPTGTMEEGTTFELNRNPYSRFQPRLHFPLVIELIALSRSRTNISEQHAAHTTVAERLAISTINTLRERMGQYGLEELLYNILAYLAPSEEGWGGSLKSWLSSEGLRIFHERFLLELGQMLEAREEFAIFKDSDTTPVTTMEVLARERLDQKNTGMRMRYTLQLLQRYRRWEGDEVNIPSRPLRQGLIRRVNIEATRATRALQLTHPQINSAVRELVQTIPLGEPTSPLSDAETAAVEKTVELVRRINSGGETAQWLGTEEFFSALMLSNPEALAAKLRGELRVKLHDPYSQQLADIVERLGTIKRIHQAALAELNAQ